MAGGVAHSPLHKQAVIPRESGVSSTPRPFGSIADVSGILGRPVPATLKLRRAFRCWGAEALAKAASRAMTAGIRISNSEDRRDIDSRSRRMFLREFCSSVRLPLKKGRGECRAPDAPASRVCNVVVERTRVRQVTPVSPGIPRAMVYGLYRALPGDR